MRHLVERSDESFEPDAAWPDPAQLDATRAPSERYCPLSADSSQLAAVFAAAEGRSFVLEGPPGTGKSQTITNLVAHCLAEGKSVLFVSEKMAALEVVHRRLSAIGLGPFCLELHSNKAQKRQVVAQLGEALEVGEKRREAAERGRTAQQLEELRAHLNVYVDALHRTRATGESYFQGLSRLIALREAPEVAFAPPAGAPEIDEEQLARMRETVRRLGTTWRAASGDRQAGEGADDRRPHPLRAIGRSEWTPSFERELAGSIDGARTALGELEESLGVASRPLCIDAVAASLTEQHALDELCEVLVQGGAPPTIELVTRPDSEAVEAALAHAVEHGRRRDELRARVRLAYTDAVLGLDLDALERDRQAAEAAWFLPAWLGRRKLGKALAAVRTDGQPPAKAALAKDLEQARLLREAEQTLESAGGEAAPLLGRLWNGGEADWDEVEAAGALARRLRAVAARLARLPEPGAEAGEPAGRERAAALREAWARLAVEGRAELAVDAPLGRSLALLGERLAAWREAARATSELAEADTTLGFGAPEDPDAARTARATLEAWRDALPLLRTWCHWRRVREEAVGVGLESLLEAVEAGRVVTTELPAAFERGWYAWWCDRILEEEAPLRDFLREEHELAIERFREVDEEYEALTRELVFARLAAQVPGRSVVDLPTSETGILRKELTKKRRHMPLRKLFGRIPNLLPRLKPCLLLSPMSVAQYLDPDYPPFDLVVFDEASQIPVWDAIGAVARGRQAVVVGDPKQLPPTSFFQRAAAEGDGEWDDELDEIPEDQESVLDECIASGLKRLSLAWHYRSRHESLIAFSNHRYYENRLLTFPSPWREGMGVGWRHVSDGVYDKGDTRTNRREAEEVVAEIVKRLAAARGEDEPWSLGVVTFSQAQQHLIEDLLEVARREDPTLERFFSDAVPEPVFVKNLENVQGDERDVILFSIGYGPDAEGRVSMNFGPMNRDGGERRLNVAITRARREVLVVSTLRAEDIDLARTRARGARDLKAFLAFAERGVASIAEATAHETGGSGESPFERTVREALEAKGWTVHAQVGCSGYRIDLAVVDPEDATRYLLGIEADGANYRSAPTARDRDKLRELVLRGLDWSLVRLWSGDWQRDPAGELARVEDALAVATERREAERSAEAEALAERAAAELAAEQARAAAEEALADDGEALADDGEAPGVLESLPDTDGADHVPPVDEGGERLASAPTYLDLFERDADGAERAEVDGGATTEAAPGASAGALEADGDGGHEPGAGSSREEEDAGDLATATDEDSSGSGDLGDDREPAAAGPEVYGPVTLAPRGTEDAYFESGSDAAIVSAIEEVVRREGPISLELAARRVAAAWTFHRLTQRVRERVEGLVGRAQVRAAEDATAPGRFFLWPPGDDPAAFDRFRVPAEDGGSGEDVPETERELDDLPSEELLAAAVAILRANVSAPADDVARETAKLFGFARLGSSLKERIGAVLDRAVEEGRLAREGDSLVLS